MYIFASSLPAWANVRARASLSLHLPARKMRKSRELYGHKERNATAQRTGTITTIMCAKVASVWASPLRRASHYVIIKVAAPIWDVCLWAYFLVGHFFRSTHVFASLRLVESSPHREHGDLALMPTALSSVDKCSVRFSTSLNFTFWWLATAVRFLVGGPSPSSRDAWQQKPSHWKIQISVRQRKVCLNFEATQNHHPGAIKSTHVRSTLCWCFHWMR